jgi:hypothetical protein
MKKSSNTLFWLLSLIIVAIAAYWFGTAQVTAPQEEVEEQAIKQEQTASTIPTPTTPPSEKEAGNLLYTNEKYHFVLQLPPRWKEYKVEEKTLTNGESSYNFQLKTKNGEYHSVFYLSAVTEKTWQKLQSEEGPKSIYIDKKNGYVFSFMTGHDDDGFAGFPEVVPEITFKGPYFDVINIIIPSFSFTQ